MHEYCRKIYSMHQSSPFSCMHEANNVRLKDKELIQPSLDHGVVLPARDQS